MLAAPPSQMLCWRTMVSSSRAPPATLALSDVKVRVTFGRDDSVPLGTVEPDSVSRRTAAVEVPSKTPTLSQQDSVATATGRILIT